MNADKRRAEVRQIVDKIKYITLATVSEANDPWNAPVFFAHQEYRTFYWGSRRAVQHSQNIRSNGKGYIVIYDSTIPPGKGRAVYIQAKCEELSDPEEIKLAVKLLHDRYGETYMVAEKMRTNPTHRLYKATLQRAWVKNEDIDVREEVTDL
jgi:nitroimidazol reductase NimA-like FMN-containing flavoprotein (pyridoxamine 5'-phosphate oxidase superfamily)